MSDDIKFFTESDYVNTKDGKKILGSEYPSYYFDSMVDEISESIRTDEMALESNMVPKDRISDYKTRIKRNQKRLDVIKESKDAISENDKNKFLRVRKELEKEISRLMFTRSQMQKGIADAHQEARRMVEPSIKVSAEIAGLAEACNVPITDGKISRKGAEKIWKITGKQFGEITNTEILRRD